MRRARWSFWILVGVAVLAAGSLDAGLGAQPSPLTGLRVAVSGIRGAQRAERDEQVPSGESGALRHRARRPG